MNYTECVSALRKFIVEVLDYYERCNHHSDGRVTISRQMVTYVLKLSEPELERFICTLAEDGLVTIVNDEVLTFVPTLITDRSLA